MSLSLWNDDFFTRPMDLSLGRSLGGTDRLTSDLTPLMGTDLIENKDCYKVCCDLPGVPPEDVEVTVQDKYLCLKAERKAVHEEKTDKILSMERQYGVVQRKIRVPHNVDMDNIQTNMKHGVLTITMPKKPTPEHTVKKLSVNVDH
jgi:HSP20 family protein